MKKLSIQPLTLEAFQKYGTFAPMTPPTAKALAKGDIISFWPDCGGVLDLGPVASNQLALGICQVAWRELQVDVSEFHTATGEGNLPLDGDIYIHVAPPTADDTMPVDAIEIFFVPKGTMVIMKAGVWHHAPFSTKPGKTVNTVILLPQRTYANDCVVSELETPIPFGE
ncbi:MAG TPA: ureidoglycolate lyase [Armatimonadota bacterium]|jgi:ureidoglycolate lyase